MFGASKLLAVGAFVAGLLLPAQAMAAYEAHTRVDLNLRVGPATNYGVIDVIPAGYPVTVIGCLDAFNWCDVDFEGLRGWVSASYLVQPGTSVYLPQVAPRLGLPIISFSFNVYHDRHYSGRPWHRHRVGQWRSHRQVQRSRQRRQDVQQQRQRPKATEQRRQRPKAVQQRRQRPQATEQRRQRPQATQQRRQRSQAIQQQRRQRPQAVQQRRQRPQATQQRRLRPQASQQRRQRPQATQQRRQRPQATQQRRQGSQALQQRRGSGNERRQKRRRGR